MRIHEKDNVEVNLENGHKYALRDIASGEDIIKYGNPIGHATCPIQKGEHVHSHNLATNLSGMLEYRYDPVHDTLCREETGRTFLGYPRKNGDVGIRNEVWIIPTVGCVNKIAQRLAEKTGCHAFPHPFGCSQLGQDQQTTELLLRGLVNHPNAAGVLVLGLGCENNNISEFQQVLGEYDPQRVRFLNCQDTDDEIAAGTAILQELKAFAATQKAVPVPVSRLRVGLKCGGSDGYSGITANPLVGRFSDRLISLGGSCILSEVPEMFGAEHLLMQRCENREIFDKTVRLINGFKEYYERHDQPVYENPSPGNKAGGITTLEEKSLGCVQKAGSAAVVDVLGYGDTVQKNGLSLLDGPGNDMVAVTNLAAAGAHLILFTTGRGTPLGGPVPTVKIATNETLAKTKKNWVDFDSSGILRGEDPDDAFFEYVLGVASGKETKNEQNGYREISLFKSGVTL